MPSITLFLLLPFFFSAGLNVPISPLPPTSGYSLIAAEMCQSSLRNPARARRCCLSQPVFSLGGRGFVDASKKTLEPNHGDFRGSHRIMTQFLFQVKEYKEADQCKCVICLVAHRTNVFLR